MFITAIFTIAERWKQSKYPSSNAEMNKLWEIYIMEYHSAVRSTEVLIPSITWMNLENIMLNKRRKDTKGHILCNPLYMKHLK